MSVCLPARLSVSVSISVSISVSVSVSPLSLSLSVCLYGYACMVWYVCEYVNMHMGRWVGMYVSLQRANSTVVGMARLGFPP